MSRPDPDELLAAYVDGVGELTPDERRAVEARLPELRADADATRALLGALRELPADGTEPAWTELARRISDEVGPVAPRRWWTRLPVPAAGALVLAACALVWLHGDRDVVRALPAPAPVAEIHAAAPPAGRDDVATTAMWLDGDMLELGDDIDADALDDLFPRTAREGDDLDDIVGGSLLSAPDLAWIDDLDPESLARAERWLADRKGT